VLLRRTYCGQQKTRRIVRMQKEYSATVNYCCGAADGVYADAPDLDDLLKDLIALASSSCTSKTLCSMLIRNKS
jgi:hypothetical protein